MMSRLHTHGRGLVVVSPEPTAQNDLSVLLLLFSFTLGNFFGFSFFPGVLYYRTSKEARTINAGLAAAAASSSSFFRYDAYIDGHI